MAAPSECPSAPLKLETGGGAIAEDVVQRPRLGGIRLRRRRAVRTDPADIVAARGRDTPPSQPPSRSRPPAERSDGRRRRSDPSPATTASGSAPRADARSSGSSTRKAAASPSCMPVRRAVERAAEIGAHRPRTGEAEHRDPRERLDTARDGRIDRSRAHRRSGARRSHSSRPRRPCRTSAAGRRAPYAAATSAAKTLPALASMFSACAFPRVLEASRLAHRRADVDADPAARARAPRRSSAAPAASRASARPRRAGSGSPRSPSIRQARDTGKALGDEIRPVRARGLAGEEAGPELLRIGAERRPHADAR